MGNIERPPLDSADYWLSVASEWARHGNRHQTGMALESARSKVNEARQQLEGAVSREHAIQAIGWLSAEVALHGAPELGPEWLELWERALTATGGQ